MTIRALTLTTLAVSAGLVLSACSNSSDTAAPPSTTTATVTAEATSPAPSSSAEVAGTEEDPAFGAIDAVLAAHAGGVIVSIDRDYRDEHYEVDVVVGDQVLDLKVDYAGQVSEDDRDSDSDDIRKAQNATLSAADAIRQALEQHPDGVLDDAELDEDNGRLQWEISLDDQSRNDLVELNIPAN
ncbi:hypothetical protein HCH15_04190 [Corynebacterium testudinoris]|uniref:Peptidase propeptide domain-containing protein n=1 Tax=Corynebacterium testudinoris TaxID=136857 RepID=A0A0G3HCS1_9CORY|nr:PepSY domain-containing protein [Corynebacterium testudinoris]AKK08972.1 Peptidase propeptide domain-containing protein [Corynebacterium testudinoris]MBX8995378.1 hypothetical protein [Corynebacterium testudinoris]